ncbi:NAD-dependent epimerase/dehydratase family protein [Pseudobacter ginsenosidimutans]|uniref:Nucleoside-diphosphate-sugar epimerase n=1 Tax=Pseudobacter ginsenosidimutans TaxID=661488 RepID=A0A4Q7MUL3_9BACT|nr:NAD-dependent epimerase/dehydratase family protein [Pseudobacter ginsenosidimutans]QEC40987.1 NAD-dependent epimerase/dehydratase family protein [Pseudobacter ginsenosidimutans]RZS72268.1 nucleoside-diphosphate-sugar epimerase [Pseudobacter ginsenosidimutans]
MGLHTILGANGTIADALVPVLQANNEKIRLVSRKPKPVPGAETFTADVTSREQVFAAVKGSEIVYLLVGIQYNIDVWRRDWPVIIRNVIDACKAANATLVFFDNAYMYGKVDGPITEETPYRPSSKKGQVRAGIATTLQEEMRSGGLKAIIARAVDFYGPGVTEKSAPGLLVFTNMRKGKKAQWFINPNVPRSYNYTPDAGKALYMLAKTPSATGQVWHLPTVDPPLTGKQFVAMAAKYMNASDKVKVLPRWILKIAGLFNPFIKEMYEMHYQDELPFVFNSSKFEKAFDFKPTSWEEGIRQTAEWYKQQPVG